MLKRTLGLIFANMHDDAMGDMTAKRSMASLPYGGRYRLIDFYLSSLMDAGVTKVGVIAKNNYHSLMDHLGSGRAWDLSRKREGLSIFPPHRYFEETESLYNGRVQALFNVLSYIRNSAVNYVVMMDCDYVCNLDIDAVVTYHMESGADVTMLCCEQNPCAEMTKNCVVVRTDETGRAREMYLNRIVGDGLLSMNVYVISKELLISIIEDAMVNMLRYFVSDILLERIDELTIRTYIHRGFVRRVYNTQSYYEANMALLDHANLRDLFTPARPVYTKVRDEAPVRYGLDAHVANALLADGCVIEGTVENSVIFRGVTVEKGAVVRNSILMQNTVVQQGAQLENIITDKDVTISGGRALSGEKNYPVYIKKASVV